MCNTGLEKTAVLNLPPRVVLALAFCFTGIGMVGCLYLSDNLFTRSAIEGDLSDKPDIQKGPVWNEVIHKETQQLMILPSKIKITDDNIDQKSYIFTFKDIFKVLWIPLVIIGSYILVNCDCFGSRIRGQGV